MKAFGYIRVSTEEQGQEERFSLPHQKEHIIQECNERGYELVHIYDDVESGKSTKKRKGFQDMLKKLEGIQIIIVHELDRFSRNIIDTLLTIEEFGKQGVKFLSIHDAIDTSDENGELQLHIIAVFAQYFRKQLSRKVLGGMTTRANQGGYNTKAPLGYDLIDKVLNINEQEAPIVQKIYQYYLDNMGIRAIAEELNSLGYRSKPTKNFPGGAPFQAFPVRVILKNAVYTGASTWKGIVVENTHPAIISEQMYHTVQQRIIKKSEMGGRAQASDFLLSGVIKCGHCGQVMTGNKNNGRFSKTKGRAPVYRRYVCNNYQKNGGCKYIWGHCEDIDKSVLDCIEALIPREEAPDYLSSTPIAFDPHLLEKEHKNLSNSLTNELPHRYDKQIQLFEKGLIDEEKLKIAFDRLKAEETEINKKLQEIETQLSLSPEAKTELRKAQLANFYEIFDSGDIAKRKAWIQTKIKEIRYYDKGNMQIDFYI